MPLMPGAEPFRHDGGPIGALLCHGFTGTPQSLRPWAEHLAGEGLSVRLPRLPGHGTSVAEANLTTWTDWYAELERNLLELSDQCAQVFVMGSRWVAPSPSGWPRSTVTRSAGSYSSIQAC